VLPSTSTLELLLAESTAFMGLWFAAVTPGALAEAAAPVPPAAVCPRTLETTEASSSNFSLDSWESSD
jgi:hypothetical protein